MQEMLDRLVRPKLLERLQTFPAVVLVGPRQCGKTTLAQSLEGRYFDLEQESERLRADLEWDSLVASKGLVIFDEAQSWPELFTRLRGAIDLDEQLLGKVEREAEVQLSIQAPKSPGILPHFGQQGELIGVRALGVTISVHALEISR